MTEPVNPSPRSGTEERLLVIWRDVLQNDAIKTDQDFVDLGGDSLAAMMCISRVRAAFGTELELEDFFYDEATISRQAAIIEKELTTRE